MSITRTEWQIPAGNNQSFSAYVALPAQKPSAAVVVIQEIFGVNGFIRETADDLAAKGFLAVAPDLFWRLEPNVQLTDKSKEEWDKAFGLMNRFDIDQGIRDIQAVITHTRAQKENTGKVGAIGYCLGGKLAYLTAARTDIDCSVGYYGVALETLMGEASSIKSRLMLHIAEEDKFVSKDAQRQIKHALDGNAAVTVHSYAGVDHAFARMGGEHFDANAAQLANGRTLDFLRQNLA
ncbi:MAG: dienelactone hydrolase family protein [Alphaproteobacteria bacterium]|nr:dienelactone hydrolase family protein [Alphaproteobacteria bacterium]